MCAYLQWLRRRHATLYRLYIPLISLESLECREILNDAITPVCSVRSIIDGRNVTVGKFVFGYLPTLPTMCLYDVI